MTRDVLDLLAQARPADLDPALPTPAETRTAELAYAMAGGRAARRRFAAVRPAWLAAGLTGIAATAAVAVAVAGVSATPRGSDHAAAPPQTTSPDNMLLVAAAHAAKAPASGTFWHTKTISGSQTQVPGGYRVEQRYSAEEWWPAQKGKPSYSVRKYLGATPATDADKTAWQAAGSPTRWAISVAPGKANVPKQSHTIESAPGPEQAFKDDADTGLGMLANQPVTRQLLASLPTDPAGLRRYFEPRLNRLHANLPAGVGPSTDQQLFGVALSLIVHMPVTPQTRAAAYRLIATLPSVVYHASARDPLGRSGTAVGVAMPSGPELTELRLIFDPATGRPLATGVVLTGGDARTRIGRYIGFALIEEPGWVDRLPDRPFVTVRGVG